MKRQIVLDTETTGLRPEDGHKMVEIGAVELIDGKKTGNNYHVYINPKRHIPDEVVAIHGITNEKVKTCPTFEQVVDDFLSFINGAELLIHNADFDLKFLNAELSNANKEGIWSYASNSVCTLKLSQRLFPEEALDQNGKKIKHKLDHMCIRLGVDNSHRDLHGALLDADLLADVYIKICEKFPTEDIEADLEQKNWVRQPVKRINPNMFSFKEIILTNKEEKEHMVFLEVLEKKEKVKPVFSNTTKVAPS